MSKRAEMLREQREKIYCDQHGLCKTCGMPLALCEAELAHKIPDALWANAKWGRQVIDHEMNKAMTHRGYCNDQQNIQNKPLECNALVRSILREIQAPGRNQ